MQKRPISLVLLSLLLFLAGITAVWDICTDWSGPGLYVEFSINHINFAVLFVGIGPGLYFLKNGWRICVLSFVWFTISLTLLMTVAMLILTPSLPDFSSTHPDDINPFSVMLRYAPMYFAALCAYWTLSNEQVQRLFKRVEKPSTTYQGMLFILFILWILGVFLFPFASFRFYDHVQQLKSLYANIETELQPEIEFIKNHPGDSNLNFMNQGVKDALVNSRILEVDVVLSQSGYVSNKVPLKFTNDDHKRQEFPANVGEYQIGRMTMESGKVYPIAIYTGQTHDGLAFEMTIDTSTFAGPKLQWFE